MADFCLHPAIDLATAGAADVCEPVPAGLDLAPYLVSNAAEIALLLQPLIACGTAVTLYLPDRSANCPGWLIADRAGHLAFRAASVQDLPPGSWLFVGLVQGVKVQFSCEVQTVARHDGAFAIPHPDSLVWLQRRRFVRLGAPLGRFRAEFVAGFRNYALSIEDISLGGVGLRASPKEGGLLYVGRKLLRARLELGLDEIVTVDMEVRSRRLWHTYLLGEQFHVGCRFIALAPSAHAGLQRVMHEFGQREHGRGTEWKE